MNHVLQQHKADFFKAMSSPMRLSMLEILDKEDSSVTQLAERVGLDISTTSRHLSQLRAAGVVEASRQGTTLMYRLSDERVGELLRLARSIIATRLHATSEMLADLAE
jgi:ArsR family transcriptional regulator, arsenate/arsenite/antimonite-responsive transcriptional repressor